MFLNYGGTGNVGVPTPNRRQSQPFTYIAQTTPSTLPVTLEEAKQQLNILTTDTTHDASLTLMIEAARDAFQKYTNRILINTQFLTYFDYFVQVFELRRSKLVSIETFQYLNTSLDWTDFDSSIYYVTDEEGYSRIIIDDPTTFPSDKADRVQSVKVVFTAGYGESETDIPTEIRLALLTHVAYLFNDRGDCSCDEGSMSSWMSSLPTTVRRVYNNYRISQLYGSSYRGAH